MGRNFENRVSVKDALWKKMNGIIYVVYSTKRSGLLCIN